MLLVDCVLHPSLKWVGKVFIRKLRSPLRGGLAVGPKNIECWERFRQIHLVGIEGLASRLLILLLA